MGKSLYKILTTQHKSTHISVVLQIPILAEPVTFVPAGFLCMCVFTVCQRLVYLNWQRACTKWKSHQVTNLSAAREVTHYSTRRTDELIIKCTNTHPDITS